MQARDIMTKEPRTLTMNSTVSEAARLMRELDVGMIPIVDSRESRHLEGVITDRDIAVRHVAESHTDDCKVSDHMSSTLTTVGPDEDITGVMERMREKQIRRIPVVEDGGRLVGIVAQADLALDTGPDEAEGVAETLKKISESAEPRH